MRTFLTLLGREIKSYFYSPIAYVVMFFFTCATGFDFFGGVSLLNQKSVEVTVVEVAFNTILFWIPLLLFYPLITMRTYADEFRMGTIESLTTAPVRDWEVVLAKFCGAVFFYCVLWTPSIAYFVSFPLITGKEAAMASGAYWGTYLFLLLAGMFYISMGCLASALSTEQINAAVVSFVLIFTFFVAGLLTGILGITDPGWRELEYYGSAYLHMSDFQKGLIDSRPIVWYLSMTALFLAINFQVFQYRKWKA